MKDSALRNMSENSDGQCIPQGVLARARRFAIIQLSREEGGQQAWEIESNQFTCEECSFKV